MASGISLVLGSLLACSGPRAGIVHVEAPGHVALQGYSGGSWTLVLGAESRALRGAAAAVVELRGPRLAGRIWVRDWRVLDAGDGSGGFVGEVRAHGSRMVIDDRNSGTTLLLDDRAAASMRALDGAVVLVEGHVVGGGMVEVMAYRVLEAAPTDVSAR